MESSKEKICSITGCDKPSKRSFAASRIGPSITEVGLKVKDSRDRKTYLCQDHWKKVKKAHKKDTKAERMRWGH
ncbi:MAG: hypothetical protein P1Q69_09430 [Candidatus Thorarchaeota archaeon]|nr:hypothetical protein [Candidatus Thorarchaeota archaeon]